ncbi:bactofilin family protein [Enterobacter pasteurii]|nr:polymer-forming cytoskeletal protein [Enterobacter pasteurii]
MKYDSDQKNSVFLNAGIFLWGMALLAWCYEYRRTATACFLLLSLSFAMHIQQEKMLTTMFGKNKTTGDKDEALPFSVTPTTPSQIKKNELSDPEPLRSDRANSTIIATDVEFEGNINAGGQVYVYGKVKGNMTSAEGLVKVMDNGLVEGNILCRELIIDGTIEGHCQANSIHICEHGRLDGTMTYDQFSVKKGGVFTGQAIQSSQCETVINVIGINHETFYGPIQEAKTTNTKLKE